MLVAAVIRRFIRPVAIVAIAAFAGRVVAAGPAPRLHVSGTGGERRPGVELGVAFAVGAPAPSDLSLEERLNQANMGGKRQSQYFWMGVTALAVAAIVVAAVALSDGGDDDDDKKTTPPPDDDEEPPVDDGTGTGTDTGTDTDTGTGTGTGGTGTGGTGTGGVFLD